MLERLLRWDIWANRETWRSLTPRPVPPKSLRWLAHIVGAETLWLDRIAGQPASLPAWPELSLEQCDERLHQLSPVLLEAARGSDLNRTVGYTNSKGEPWTSSVEEILTHVVVHSAYHRGQIASDVRSAGHEPAYTDFIHAVRQRLI
jgi:uncharacterized damage-inducible protein DinB